MNIAWRDFVLAVAFVPFMSAYAFGGNAPTDVRDLPDHLSVTSLSDKPGVCAVAFVFLTAEPPVLNEGVHLCLLPVLANGPEIGWIGDRKAGWTVSYAKAAATAAKYAASWGLDQARLSQASLGAAATAGAQAPLRPGELLFAPVGRPIPNAAPEAVPASVAGFIKRLAEAFQSGSLFVAERTVEKPVWRKGPVSWSIRMEPAPPPTRRTP